MKFSLQIAFLVLLLASVMLASVKARKLTPLAALTGGLLGLMLYAGSGFIGVSMVGLFFLLGTMATSWKREFKESKGLSEQGSNRRKASQVLANAGVAALCSGLAYYFPQYTSLYRLMMAAALCAATADTLSSELGNIYGRRFYNILSLKKDTRGLDGVVSLEGTLLGMLGNSFIALVYLLGFGADWKSFMVLMIAGTLGNLADSVLGASLERKNILNNDFVNTFNTLAAALAAGILYFWI